MRKDKLIKINDVIDWTNYSRSTIYKMLSDDAFPPPIKVRGTIRWRESDIVRFVAMGFYAPRDESTA